MHAARPQFTTNRETCNTVPHPTLEQNCAMLRTAALHRAGNIHTDNHCLLSIQVHATCTNILFCQDSRTKSARNRILSALFVYSQRYIIHPLARIITRGHESAKRISDSITSQTRSYICPYHRVRSQVCASMYVQRHAEPHNPLARLTRQDRNGTPHRFLESLPRYIIRNHEE